MSLSPRKEALNKIRNLIFSGELGTDRFFSEREIAEQLAISRTHVREALAVLAALALIDQYPQKGIRVRTISTQEVMSILKINAGVEDIVVKELAQRQQSDALNYLRNLVYQMENSTDPKKFVTIDTQFHCEMAHLAECSPAVSIIRGLRDRFHLFKVQHQRLLKDHNSEIVEEYLKIIGSAGESIVAAISTLKEHFSNEERRLLSDLQQ